MAGLILAPIAITGWGSVCALGADTRTAVAGLRAGRRALTLPTRSPHLIFQDHKPLPVGEAPVDLPVEHRARGIVDIALDEAMEMAGPHAGPVGVFVGTTAGFFVDAEVRMLAERRSTPDALPQLHTRGQGLVAEHVAHRIKATGPTLTFSMACTSGAAAMAAAADHMRAGICTRAVVVGMDPLSTLTVQGFRSLMLIDPELSRPFDTTRAGLQLGEGCGVVVLDLGEGAYHMLDSANRLDPSHLTASSTDGSTAAEVILGAISRSGLTPADVVSIKGHGTGTGDNDLAEGRGIARAFDGAPPPFASLKGAIGHTLGGAGVIEVALWLGCLTDGFLPASIGFSQQDPQIGISPTTRVLPAPKGAHLFNAFGFGGSCVALVVRDA